MIHYRVHIEIDNDVADQWIEWMRSEHIPEVLNTGYFERARLVNLKSDNIERKVFEVEYECVLEGKLEEYFQKHSPELRRKHDEIFGGRFSAERAVFNILKVFDR